MRDTILDAEIVEARELDGCPECGENLLTIYKIDRSIGSVSKYHGYLWRCYCPYCKKTTVLIPRR
jgi:uncharacterized protein with PIN domain